MRVVPTSLPGVLVLEPKVYGDARGWFMESYNRRALRELAGIDHEFVQDNQSRSGRHVLRGLHYQLEQAQGKLVRVLAGRIWDIAVDVRRSSPAFGKWAAAELDAESKRMMWVPPGFAHGFVVLSDHADVLYKTTDYYAPQHERVLLWRDPALAIDWPVAEPQVSDKDRAGKPLAEADVFP
jgi:dTDP-4-dehydrorhamnose 3,5-epimerase